MIKIGKKSNICKKLLTIAFVLCTMIIMMMVTALSVNAATSWTFGHDAGQYESDLNGNPAPPGSLRFNVSTTGSMISGSDTPVTNPIGNSLYKYNSDGTKIVRAATSDGGAATYFARYCTSPYMRVYIGTQGIGSFSSTGFGEATRVTYIADDVQQFTGVATSQGNATSTWKNATKYQQIVCEWDVDLTGSNDGLKATIKWTVTYNIGASDFQHQWSIVADKNNSRDIVGGYKLYYGGHHRLGGGSASGYSYYDSINNAIYTWGKVDNNNGLYMLRSDDTSMIPASYYTNAMNATTTNAAPNNGTPYTSVPAANTITAVDHTVFFMHWQNTTATLAPEEDWTIKATEGILSEGNLSIIPPSDETDLPGAIVSYEFKVLNLPAKENETKDITVEYSVEILPGSSGADLTGWSATLISPDTHVFTAASGVSRYNLMDKVLVDVKIPDGAVLNDDAILKLTATIVDIGGSPTNNPYKSTVITKVDPNLPRITAVEERGIDTGIGTMNVGVKFVNHPDGDSTSQATQIYIFDENRLGIGNTTGELPATAYAQGTGYSLPDGSILIVINDISQLVPGETYTIKAIVAGIKNPGYGQFYMRGNETDLYIWRDTNANNTREPFEGIAGVDVTLVETLPNASSFTFNSKSVSTALQRGYVVFDGKGMPGGTRGHSNNPLSSYVITPNLQKEYAVKEITAIINGEDYDTFKLKSDFIDIFEYFTINVTTGVTYKFNSGKTAQITLYVQIDYSTVVEVYTHLGQDKNNLFGVDDITVTHTPPGLTTSSSVSTGPILASSLPYEAIFVARSNANISVTAPEGFRMANGLKRTETRDQSNLNPFLTHGAYPAHFEVRAGDVQFIGITNNTVSSQTESATQMTSNPERVEVLVDQSWTGIATRLDFKAWDNTGNPITNPTRANYTWTIISNADGIIESLGATTGIFKFTDKIGQAVVRVALTSNPDLYHEMEITVAPSSNTYSSIYLALPNDINTPITQIALVTNTPKQVVVVGIDSVSSNPVKIRNSVAAVMEIFIPHKLTIVPTPGDFYTFNLTGTTSGITQINGLVSGSGNTPVVDVLITNLPLSEAKGIEITPNPINLTSGQTENVTYTLVFNSNPAANNVVLTTKFVNAALATGTHATLNTNGSQITFASIGTDTLTATLTLDTTKRGTAPVNCTDGLPPVVPPVGGVLTLQEVTSPSLTNGFIENTKTAEYIAFFDLDGNGEYDAGEQLLPYGTVNSTFKNTNGCFSLAAGNINTDNVLLTGTKVGVDKLTVTYTYGGTIQTASTDIIVYTEGYTFDGLEVTPAIIVIESEETTSFVVRAVFKKDLLIEKHNLPSTMYTGSIPSGSSVVSMVPLTQNSVKAAPMQLAAEAVYRATLNTNNNITDDADILVIPRGAVLEVTPDPLWIEIGHTGDVTYDLKLNGSSVSYPNEINGLLYYVSTNITDKTIANFVSGDVELIEGIKVGRTTLTAYLYGKANNTKIITIYVWDDTYNPGTPGYVRTGLVWDPNPLEMNSGNTKVSSVYLIDDQGAKQALVDFNHLNLGGNDDNIASIPTNPTGTTLSVTAGTVTANQSTTVTASSPAGDADLTVNVKTNVNIYGIKANPQIIEIWPGETKTVEITNTGTGVKLDNAQLNAATKTFSLASDNDVAVNGQVLDITQNSPLPQGSVNIMTVTYEGKTTEVYIINHTENPYTTNYVRSLVLNPDPALTVVGGTASVEVRLQLHDAQNGLIDNIILPPQIISWTINTSSSTLPGRITISPGNSIGIYGVSPGAQTYMVEYKVGVPLSVNGSVFVFAHAPTSMIESFKFEPEAVILTTTSPNNTSSIRGVITYTNGTVQYVNPREFPIAIENLGSSNTDAATVSKNAIITAKNNIEPDSFRTTEVTGGLIGTDLSGTTDVLVYNPNAILTIDPNSLVLWTIGASGNTPNDLEVKIYLGDKIVPNEYLTYSLNNGNVTIAPNGTASQSVTAVSEGKSVITALLKNTTKSATADVTIYDGSATYSTITYDENGGTGTIADDYRKDGTFYNIQPSIAITPPTGMQFKEWNTQDDGNGIKYTVNQQILVNGDLDLFAIWELENPDQKWTVTYNANDGTATPATTDETDDAGVTYTVLGNSFANPGYRFVKWNTQDDGNGTDYNPNDTFTLTSDVTLYAIWIKEYTVTYNANGGTGTMNPETDDAGVTYTVLGNSFANPGYRFVKWNTQDDGNGTDYNPNGTFTLDSDVTLYAIWELIPVTQWTVTYDANGGTGTMNPETDDEGATYTVLGNSFANLGYRFVKWNTQDDGNGTDYDPNDTFTLDSDVTLYAIWELDEPDPKWTVTYNANGGTGTMNPDANIPDGSAYTVKPNGFTASTSIKQFKEWNEKADGNGTTYAPGQTFALTGDLTLYAIWESVPDGTTYEVSYDANTGTGSMPSDAGLTPGGDYQIKLNTFTKIGYQFKGWTTVEGGTTVIYGDGATIYSLNSDVTLYAIWEFVPIGITYTVEYRANGGSGTMTSDTNIAANSTHTLKTSTFTPPADKQFKEWNTDPLGSGAPYANGATIASMTSDLTLYAIWIDIPVGTTYRVTYNANGGIGIVPRDTRLYGAGEEVTILGQGLITKSGYAFVGWSLNSDGRDPIYEANDIYTINSDVTFYAVWEESTTPTPTVKYKLTVQTTTGGTVNSYVSGYYSQGERINIIATPNKGSSFIKWTSSINGVVLSPSMPTTTVIMPASNVVVTAQFTSPSSSIPVIIGGGVADGGASGILPIVTEKYKVTYKANGGSGKDHVVSGLASGTIHNVLNVEDTKISYSKRIFTGWNTKADGSGKDYMPGDSILIIEDVILYAQWNTKVELKKNNHITYLNGYTDGTVKPDNAITRAEATSIFYRLLEKQGTVAGGAFTDVKNGEWYAEAINYLASVGIATGYDNGTYAPEKPITRLEFTVMAVKFEDMVASSDNITFSDIPKTHWAYHYINSGVTRGWISGFPDGTFKPDESITRAQVVKIINAMLNRKVDDAALAKVKNPYTDLDKSHWAYSEIIEASTAHEYTRDANGKEIWE